MVLAGYLVDAAGLGVQPWLALVMALVVAAFAASDRRRRDHGDVVAWIAVCGFVFAALIRLGGPDWLLPGRGPDLAHHLLLVDYIERAGHLVHDRALDGAMGEMAHYTPGAHLLAVSAGRWFRVDALQAFFPLLCIAAALTAGFVFLIARRLALPVPYALAGVALLFLPSQYFSGAFTHDSFLGQTVATFFAVAAWWALVAFDQRPSTIGAARIGILIAAVFLSWPIWSGPLVVVLLAMSMSISQRSAFAKASADRAGPPMIAAPRLVIVALLPLFIVASIHIAGRWGWLVIVRTSGAVLEPGVASIGWVLPLLAIAGVVVAARDRRARATVVLLMLIVLQAVTLYVIARSQGAATPYMAFKMVYLAIYPMAVVAAVALAAPERMWFAPARESGESKGALGWLVAAALVVAAVRPALSEPRVLPVVDLDLYRAGQWARANVGQSCVDYLVADAETAYWLHLAVLGNPRASERMTEVDRYEPRAAVAPWLTAEGRGHAVADLRRLPDEVRSRVEIVKQFGHAAVIARSGAGNCM